MSDTPLANEIRLVESLSKVFAVGLGALYLLGFLVVATYLSRYGVSSFSVLQLQYLLAGIWVLGPFALHSTVVYAARRVEVVAAPGDNGNTNWPRYLFVASFTSIPAVIFMALIFSIPKMWEELTWGIGLKFLAFYLTMVFCAVLLWMSGNVAMEKETTLVRRALLNFYSVTLFMLVLGYAAWFSVHIYPLIPSSLGGGRPLTVVFFEGDKKMPDEIQREGSTKRSVPYKLVLATDKNYVVLSLSPKERSMEISRDSVAGMIVLE